MAKRSRRPHACLRADPGLPALPPLTLALLLALPGAATAQLKPDGTPASPLADAQLTWQQCTRLGDDKDARLACFDRWAQQQATQTGNAWIEAWRTGRPVPHPSPGDRLRPAFAVNPSPAGRS